MAAGLVDWIDQAPSGELDQQGPNESDAGQTIDRSPTNSGADDITFISRVAFMQVNTTRPYYHPSLSKMHALALDLFGLSDPLHHRDASMQLNPGVPSKTQGVFTTFT